MRRRLSVALPVLATLLLTGCGGDATFVRTDPTVMTPKPSGYEMPFSYEPADRAHRVLGEIRVSSKIEPTYKETSTFDQVLLKMRRRAIRLGADAIVNLKTLDTQDGGRHGKLTLVGTLVIYTVPPAMSKAGQ